MRLAVLATLAALAGCSTQVNTAAFEKVKKRTCECKDAACASALVADVHHLRAAGSEPEDAGKAKAALDDALACALKLDPDIGKKLAADFAP